MQRITTIAGRAIPMRGNDIDTDRIVPARFLRAITFDGMETHLFEDDRKMGGPGHNRHPFDVPAYQGASIMLVNSNFGCGSSREHAAWALLDAGFRIVIAPSFADIFRNNAVGNGMLPIALPDAAVATILDRAEQHDGYAIDVSLETCRVKDACGLDEPFTIDPASRQRLLDGKDEIDLILHHEPDIAAFERRRSDAHAG